MAFTPLYIPVLRARQQELLVLKDFDFEDRMYPMLEIIKEKDRANNLKAVELIWQEHVAGAHAQKVLVDLPTYIKDSPTMSDEVLAFNRTTLSNIDNRIGFYNYFIAQREKVVPVVSTLFPKTGLDGTISAQYNALRNNFPEIAIRTFSSTFERDLPEITQLLAGGGILIYDLDTAQPMSPLARIHMRQIDALNGVFRIMIRSAIKNDIQNVKLDHGAVVPDADNSLLDVFRDNVSYHLNAFGDYAGVKKDELSSGGTISPGLIIYDPVLNLYYGYRGEIKSLDEFALRIVPAVLDSPMFQQIRDENPDYLNEQNWGYQTLLNIRDGVESGKSQAKFKRVSLEHYLHCIRIIIRSGQLDQ